MALGKLADRKEASSSVATQFLYSAVGSYRLIFVGKAKAMAIACVDLEAYEASLTNNS